MFQSTQARFQFADGRTVRTVGVHNVIRRAQVVSHMARGYGMTLDPIAGRVLYVSMLHAF